MLDISWEEASYIFYNKTFYSRLCPSSGSSSKSVVHELDCPGGLVRVAVNAFFHLLYLSVIDFLVSEYQDVYHVISLGFGVGFRLGVRVRRQVSSWRRGLASGFVSDLWLGVEVSIGVRNQGLDFCRGSESGFISASGLGVRFWHLSWRQGLALGLVLRFVSALWFGVSVCVDFGSVSGFEIWFLFGVRVSSRERPWVGVGFHSWEKFLVR